MQKCQLCGRWFKGKKADHVCEIDRVYEERECVICHLRRRKAGLLSAAVCKGFPV